MDWKNRPYCLTKDCMYLTTDKYCRICKEKKEKIKDLKEKIRNSHEIYKNASDEDLFYYGLGFVIDDLKERGLIK